MKNQECIDTILPAGRRSTVGPASWVQRLRHQVARWLERSRQRHHLAALDDAALRDIGLTRIDVWIETDKPFWRP